MGGRVAQWMVLDGRDLVDSVVFAATGPGQFRHDQVVTRGIPVKTCLWMAEHGYEGYLRRHIPATFFTPEFAAAEPERVQWLVDAFWAHRPPPEDYLKHVIARQTHQSAHLLVRMDVPSLVLVGDRDTHQGGTGSHWEQSRYLAAHLPDASFRSIPGAAHGYFWQAPPAPGGATGCGRRRGRGPAPPGRPHRLSSSAAWSHPPPWRSSNRSRALLAAAGFHRNILLYTTSSGHHASAPASRRARAIPGGLMTDNPLNQKWHVTSKLERFDFYGDWLAASEHNQLSVDRSPVVARGRDLEWVSTPNDHRIAMLIGPQVGFPTQGTNLCKAIVPSGQHTGRHRHGEEAIHVLAGTGFVVVDGRRYDFHEGTTIHVPYMSEHQLFNTGEAEVAYVSGSAMDLDLFVKLGRLEQLEGKGPNEAGFEARFPAEDGQFDELGRRIALHLEDAPDEQKRREEARKAAAAAAERSGHDDADGHAEHGGHGNGQQTGGGHAGHGGHGQGRHGDSQNPHRHGAIYILMGGGESPSAERNGFTAVSVAMTNIFEEVPHTSSHCHSHTEAVLYVLEGVGFSEIDYQHYDWEAGDAVHVPPKMTRHEHFNPSDKRARTLRIEFGIRYFYEPLWQGYEKVEHRETAVARP